MKKIVAILLSSVMIFSLTACGGSGSGASSDSADTSAPKEEAAAEEADTETEAEAEPEVAPGELRTVTVAVPSVVETLGYGAWLCAVYNGYFEEEGLKLNMIPQGGTDVCKMLESGQCDFAVPSPALLFTAATSGIDMTSVYQHDCIDIFGFAVLKDGPIKDWSDFNGKSIVTDASWYFLCDPVLAEAGVDVDSIDFVSAADERSVMLAAGKVDAAFTWEKEYELWQAQGVDLVYMDGDIPLPNISNTIVCQTSFYEDPANKELIEKFGRALAKGTYFVECNPEAAAQIVVHRWPVLGISAEDALPCMPAIVKCMTPDSGLYGDGDMGRWQKALDVLVDYEIVEEGAIDLDKLIKNSEFLEGYNDWDKEALKAQAESVDPASIADWTE